MNRVSGLIGICGIAGLVLAGCGSSGSDGPDEQSGILFSSVARTTQLSAGDSDCPNGGILVESGIDENGNGLLDDDEVDTAEKVCNGLDGADGVDGSDGMDGSDGADGLASLISITDEPPGINCEFGGTRIEAGVDANANNVLDAAEVTATDYNCAAPAGFDGLMFIGDTRMDGLDELLVVDRKSRNIRTLLSPLVSGAGILAAALSPDGSRIAVAGSIDNADIFELYVVNPGDSTPVVKVSGPMVSGGNVSGFYWSPDSTRLAYRADQDSDGIFELYTVFADGAGRVKVSGVMTTGGAVLPNTIAWSPDSNWLAYEADQEEDEVFQLYAARADGSQNNRVSGPMVSGGDIWLGYFQWSPDSARLAYRADQEIDGVYELYTVLPDGGGQVKVSGSTASGGSVDNFFKWSPNGSRLAYRSDEQVANRQELYTVLADGSGRVRVSVELGPGGNVLFNSYNWSPDGTRIAYKANLTSLDSIIELFAVSPDGTGGVKLSGPMTSGGDLFTYSWSPAGDRIAYLADQEIDQSRELYVVVADGSDRVKVNGDILTGGSVDFYQWSPDGSRLLYRSDEAVINEKELFTVLNTGAGRARISDSFVTGRQIVDARWSPDGSRVAFMADQRVDDQLELYTVATDGSSLSGISGEFVDGGDIFGYAWSPDSIQIAYTADQEVDEKRELYIVNADGTDQFKASPPSIDNGDVFNFDWITP